MHDASSATATKSMTFQLHSKSKLKSLLENKYPSLAGKLFIEIMPLTFARARIIITNGILVFNAW